MKSRRKAKGERENKEKGERQKEKGKTRRKGKQGESKKQRKTSKMVTNTVMQQLVERIKQFDPEKIILFGSYAYGTPSDASDVDLFVVKNIDLQDIRQTRIEMRRSLFNIVLDNKIELDLLVDNEDHINYRINIGDKFYEELTTNGKILYAKQGISKRLA
ncbi:MAG: nucleotidyltransferase domain-containing protein [Bacteroidia bacterium]|nr:nucleotidyltransferase domain-containing protein [Bacteroidia bacterium]